jgi:hypothetical protein
MKTLRGFLLSTTVLALGIAIIGEASAQDFDFNDRDRRGGDQQRDGDHRGGSNDAGWDQDYGRGGRIKILRQTLYQTIHGQETLQIRQIVGLRGPQHAGKKIKFVTISAKSEQRHRGGRGGNGGWDRPGHGGGYGPRPMPATAQLMIDGRTVGYPQTISPYMSEVRFQLPKGQNTLGRDIRRLQVQVTGRRVTVGEVTVGVKRQRHGGGGHGRTETISANTHQVLVGYGVQTPLASLLQADYSAMSKTVMKVTMEVNAPRGNATMQICEKNTYGRRGNGLTNCSTKQYTAGRHQQVTFYTSGSQLQNLVLVSEGRVVVKRVSAEVQGQRRY